MTVWLIAHGIVGRADLPIPVFWFGVAAAGVLVVSFLMLAGGWMRPRVEHWRERPLVRIPLLVEILLGAIGVFVFAVSVYAGLAGNDIAALVLAHDRALVLYGSPRAAARSQIVMLVVMVLFTVLGLWLLSAALNT